MAHGETGSPPLRVKSAFSVSGAMSLVKNRTEASQKSAAKVSPSPLIGSFSSTCQSSGLVQGTAVSSVTSGAYARIIGQLFIEHFENGASLDFRSFVMR